MLTYLHKGPAPSLLTVEISPPENLDWDEVNGLLAHQIHTLYEVSGYMRTLIFQLQDNGVTLTRAKKEDLKNVKRTPGNWVVMHEFRGVVGGDVQRMIELDVHKLVELEEKYGIEEGEVKVWKLERGFGDGSVFE